MVVGADGDYGVGWGGRGHAGGRGQLVVVAGDRSSGVRGGGRCHAGVRGPLMVVAGDGDSSVGGAVGATFVGVDQWRWCGVTATVRCMCE